MLCERCKKNEANYHYKEIVNGAERSYHLCAECAAALESSGEIMGMGTNSFFDGIFGGKHMNSVYSSLFSPSLGENRRNTAPIEKRKCSLCGASFDELSREGKVGCPKCYDAFEEELHPSIVRIHGRTDHIGREPLKYREKNRDKRLLSNLEKELKEAIMNENYERAAELRDEIKRIRGSLNDEN